MKIVILILFCLMGFLIGHFIGLYNTKSVLDRGTDNQNVSLDIECDDEICPLPEENK